MKKTLILVMATLLLVMCCIGCASTPAGTAPSSEVPAASSGAQTAPATEGAAPAPEAASAEPAAGDFLSTYITGKAIKADGTPLKVGINVAELKSEFIIMAQDYAVMLLEEAGAEVSVTNANNSVDTQMNQLNDFIEMGVDVIIVQPADSEALAPAIKQINDANIPVICINRSVFGEGIFVDLAIGADDQVMGQMAADYMLNLANGTDAKVATMQGTLATANASKRAEGFQEILDQNPSMQNISDRPCDWDSETAMAATTDVLTANPDLFGIFSHSDCMLPGIIAALTQSSKLAPVGEEGHVVVIAVDGAPNALDYVRQGYLDATIEQSSPMMATVAVKAILTKVMNGIPLTGETVNCEPTLITAENVDDASLWGNFSIAGEVWPRTEEVWNTYLLD